MELETRWGKIDVDEADIIIFPQGILGFEEYKRYTVVTQEDSVFCFLQSLDEPELAFVIMYPELVDQSYCVVLSKEQIALLEIEDAEDGVVYGIVTIPEDVSEMTINLQAPIVINKKKRLGAQIVMVDSKYHTRHNVLAQMHASAYYKAREANA